jgi:hypothetical protein
MCPMTTNGCMIIDEALLQAIDGLYTRVELFPFEMRAIVETAVDDISVLKPKDEHWNTQLDKFKDSSLEVNLLDIQRFAEQMLEFGCDSGMFRDEIADRVTISPLSATLAAQRVVRIVQETWYRSRDTIIQQSIFLNVHFKQQAKRPSEYSREDVRAIISSIGLLFDNFAHCGSGHALICVPRTDVRKTFGLSSSLLLLRFLTVQRVLQLLELWSDKGASCGLPNMPFSREVQAWGLLLPALEQQVECAVFPKLLSCYRTVGRTANFAWSLSLLTQLCSRIAGNSGSLVPTSSLEDATGRHVNERLYGWVEFRGDDLELSVSLLDTLYQEGLLLIEEGRGREGQVLVLVPLLGMRCLRSDFGSNSHMLTPAIAVACDTKPSAGSKQLQQQEEVEDSTGRSGGGGELVCRVDSVESLQAACERFDWFDRPSPEMMQRMAGGLVKVVAPQDAYSLHRVGVQLLPHSSSAGSKRRRGGAERGGDGSGDGEEERFEVLIDALPIECLTIHGSGGDSDEPSSSPSSLKEAHREGTGFDSASAEQGRGRPPRKGSKGRKRTPGDTGAEKRDQGRGKSKGKGKDKESASSDNSTIATESGLFDPVSSAPPTAGGAESGPEPAPGHGNEERAGAVASEGHGKTKSKSKSTSTAKGISGGDVGQNKKRAKLDLQSTGEQGRGVAGAAAVKNRAIPTPANASAKASTAGNAENAGSAKLGQPKHQQRQGPVVGRSKKGVRLAVPESGDGAAGDVAGVGEQEERDAEKESGGVSLADVQDDENDRPSGPGPLSLPLCGQALPISRPKVITRPAALRGKASDPEGVGAKTKRKAKVPPLSSWMRASAVNDASLAFDFQEAMRRLEDGISRTAADPAHLHPAFQAMVRLEQSVRDFHGVVSREGMEETVRSFAVLKLLGKSVHPSVEGDMAARHSRGVRYTDFARYLQEREQQQQEALRRREEEPYVLAGRVLAQQQTQAEYVPFDPLREADKLAALDAGDGTAAPLSPSPSRSRSEMEEPYLQALKARKVAESARSLVPSTISAGSPLGAATRPGGRMPRVVLPRGGAGTRGEQDRYRVRPADKQMVAVVTETTRPVAAPAQPQAELDEAQLQEDADNEEAGRLASRLQQKQQQPQSSDSGHIEARGEGASPPLYMAQSLSPRERPVGALLEVSRKPLVDKGLGREEEGAGTLLGGGQDGPDAAHAHAKESAEGGKQRQPHRAPPYWKKSAIRAVASDAGVGTKEHSERVTAHAQVKAPARGDVHNGGDDDAPKGVAPTSNILSESIAVEEALRRRREGAAGKVTPVGALFAGMPSTLGEADTRPGTTSGTALRDEDFTDFVQGARLGIQKPPNRFYRVPSRPHVRGSGGDDDTVDSRAYAYALAYSSDTALDASAAGEPPRPPELVMPPAGDLADAALLQIPGSSTTRTDLTDSLQEHYHPAGGRDRDRDRDRPVTAPPPASGFEGPPRGTPRVDHLEGLAFLRPSLDQAAGVDYYGEAGGEAQLGRVLSLGRGKQNTGRGEDGDVANPEKPKVWTQDEAAPDPFRVDREATAQQERSARELRLQKSKAKFKLRPEEPVPVPRPVRGLPSSPSKEERLALRLEATAQEREGITDPDRLEAMRQSIRSHLIAPKARVEAEAETGTGARGDADEDGRTAAEDKDRDKDKDKDKDKDRDKDKGGSALLRAKVPSLPSLPRAPSEDKGDDASLSVQDASATTGNTLLQLARAVADDSAQETRNRSPSPTVVTSRPGSPGTIEGCSSLGRGYPHGPYRLDPAEEGKEAEIIAPDATAAAANAANADAAGGVSEAEREGEGRGSSLVQIGPADVRVTVRTYTAPPLYLSRQRGQIEHEKRVVRDSGLDLGALIDDLLARRERRQERAESLATPAGGLLPAVK